IWRVNLTRRWMYRPKGSANGRVKRYPLTWRAYVVSCSALLVICRSLGVPTAGADDDGGAVGLLWVRQTTVVCTTREQFVSVPGEAAHHRE
ncbi:MAG: hypothetical protein P8Y42_21055, partial [Exilibacterium sp.]